MLSAVRGDEKLVRGAPSECLPRAPQTLESALFIVMGMSSCSISKMESHLIKTYYVYLQVHIEILCLFFVVFTCFLMFKKFFIFLILPVLQHLFSPSV